MTKFQLLVSSFHFPRCLDLCSSTMIQMDGGDRLRVTLMDRISTVESRRSLTLEAVLRADKGPPPPTSSPPPPPQSSPPETPARTQANRTLLDVMRDEHHHGHGHGHGHGQGQDQDRDKTAWKSLRAKLRLKRSAAVWTSPNPISTLDTPIPAEDNVIPDSERQDRFNRLGFLLSNSSEGQSSQSDQTNHRRNADVTEDGPSAAVEREGRLRLGAALAEERALSARETVAVASAEVSPEVQPPRMSLMELLEENVDGQMGISGVAIYDMDGELAEEEEEERDGGAAAATGTTTAESGCCVCMIRSKGAAFIPCGHTFCRLCSRELWVQRGNCPLCNASILEILDIF